MKILCRIAQGFRMFFDWIFDMFDALFNKHKLMRRGIIAWLLGTLSYLMYRMLPVITPDQLMSLYSQMLGMFGAFTGFYIYLRNKDKD